MRVRACVCLCVCVFVCLCVCACKCARATIFPRSCQAVASCLPHPHLGHIHHLGTARERVELCLEEIADVGRRGDIGSDAIEAERPVWREHGLGITVSQGDEAHRTILPLFIPPPTTEAILLLMSHVLPVLPKRRGGQGGAWAHSTVHRKCKPMVSGEMDCPFSPSPRLSLANLSWPVFTPVTCPPLSPLFCRRTRRLDELENVKVSSSSGIAGVLDCERRCCLACISCDSCACILRNSLLSLALSSAWDFSLRSSCRRSSATSPVRASVFITSTTSGEKPKVSFAGKYMAPNGWQKYIRNAALLHSNLYLHLASLASLFFVFLLLPHPHLHRHIHTPIHSPRCLHVPIAPETYAPSSSMTSSTSTLRRAYFFACCSTAAMSWDLLAFHCCSACKPRG